MKLHLAAKSDLGFWIRQCIRPRGANAAMMLCTAAPMLMLSLDAAKLPLLIIRNASMKYK